MRVTWVTYGQLNELQREEVSFQVKGKHVHDLGAGNGNLALELLKLGAAKVTAIDKHLTLVTTDPRLEILEGSFQDYQDLSPEVAFVSWPSNHPNPYLRQICRRAKVVIYLGKNTDGSACGQPEFFDDQLYRELLAYHSDRFNTLVVVGGVRDLKRPPMGEELAGLNLNSGPVMYYDQVERGREVPVTHRSNYDFLPTLHVDQVKWEDECEGGQ